MIENWELRERFAQLSTPNVADACVRLNVSVAVAPDSVRPARSGARCSGRVLPVTHFGSVDVFFEAMDAASAGDVMVIDNGDRRDEGCIGDLTVLEATVYALGGIVLWGAHRDSADLLTIELPVFSTGRCPAGPRAARERTSAPLEPCRFGTFRVSRADVVFADEDGVLFVPERDVAAVLDVAAGIRDQERGQADLVRSGTSLHSQFEWDRFLATRRENPDHTFRDHLRTLSRAIEV